MKKLKKKTHPKRAKQGAREGRPGNYTPMLGSAILTAMWKHGSFRAAFRNEKFPVTRETAKSWILDGKHKEFADRYELARAILIDDKAEEIEEIAEEDPKIKMTVFGSHGRSDTVISSDAAGITRNRLRIDTKKFLLVKILPKRYGEKVEVDAGPGLLEIINSSMDEKQVPEK